MRSALNVYNRRSLLQGKSMSPETSTDPKQLPIEDWNRTFGNGHSPSIVLNGTATLNKPFEDYTQETLRDRFATIACQMTGDAREANTLIDFLSLYLRQGGLLGQLLSSMNDTAQSAGFKLAGAEAPSSPRKNSSSTVLRVNEGELIISETVEIHKIWRSSDSSLAEESNENGKALASASLNIHVKLANGELTVHNIGTRIKNRSSYAKKAFDERSILKIIADTLKFIGNKIERFFSKKSNPSQKPELEDKYRLFSRKLDVASASAAHLAPSA